jgi:hypothetical protein
MNRPIAGVSLAAAYPSLKGGLRGHSRRLRSRDFPKVFSDFFSNFADRFFKELASFTVVFYAPAAEGSADNGKHGVRLKMFFKKCSEGFTSWF